MALVGVPSVFEYCSDNAPEPGVYLAPIRANSSAYVRIALVMLVYAEDPAGIVPTLWALLNCWKKAREIGVTLMPSPSVSQT
jgi:hypothetical protein